MVTVYICDKKSVSEQEFESVAMSLQRPKYNEYRMDKIHKSRDRNLAIATAIVEKKALSDLCDYEKVRIGVEENGKPIVISDYPPNVFYNVSHSGEYAVAVAMNENVGIDIQLVTKMNDGVMKKVFSDTEIERVYAASDKDLEFTKLWAKKESYHKYTGDGIFRGMKGSEYNECFFEEIIFHNYVVSLCTGNPVDEIRLSQLI